MMASIRLERTTALSASASGSAGGSLLANRLFMNLFGSRRSQRRTIRFFMWMAAACLSAGSTCVKLWSTASRKRRTAQPGCASACLSASSAAWRACWSGSRVDCNHVAMVTSSASIAEVARVERSRCSLPLSDAACHCHGADTLLRIGVQLHARPKFYKTPSFLHVLVVVLYTLHYMCYAPKYKYKYKYKYNCICICTPRARAVAHGCPSPR